MAAHPGSSDPVGFLGESLSGRLDVVTDADVVVSYSRDQACAPLVPAGRPAAVVRPRNGSQVQAALAAAAAGGIPVVPRGAGSGLSGGANAIDGCLVVSLERMTEVLAIEPESLRARVQPGVLNASLDAAASAHGLRYAPDPASREFSTLGGNIATNAGGLCCLKHGVTRDWTLALQVVLANAEIVRIGRGTRKGVAGYDLVSLMCGSEGTLGIITEATLRLAPMVTGTYTLAASFPSLASAGSAVAQIVRACEPSMLELMDAATVQAVEQLSPQGLEADVGAMLFASADGAGRGGEDEIAAMAAICETAGATLAVTTDEAAEGRMLMNARRMAYPALERLGTTILDDVCVPIGRIPDLLDGIEAIAHRTALIIGTFGHAGDGNMHPTIVFDASDPDAVRRAQLAFRQILLLAERLGGTVSGEHGVGLLKLEALTSELGEAHGLHRAIKQALDPRDLLNPGKAV